MRGRTRKPPALRQGKRGTAGEASAPGPGLPARLPDKPDGWHVSVEAWWKALRESATAGRFCDVDVEGLFVLARLKDALACGNAKSGLAGEIRLWSECFGLTPTGRRRLGWDDVPAAPAAATSANAQKPARRGFDPDKVLHYPARTKPEGA